MDMVGLTAREQAVRVSLGVEETRTLLVMHLVQKERSMCHGKEQLEG